LEKEQTHILIIEDSADEREIYALHLSLKGYRVSMASDGKEGVEKAFELHPNLILIDLWLPTIGGWEATRRLKADERTKDCPVVVITGHAVIRPGTLECDEWLTKPCPLDELDATIAKVLKARTFKAGAQHLSEPTQAGLS
jgi:two-component system, cell cycle response regulator DivK